MTDILFAELPRIRLDWVRRPIKSTFDQHPILHEVPEECEKYAEMQNDEQMNENGLQHKQIQYHLDLNTTIGSALGKFFLFFSFLLFY